MKTFSSLRAFALLAAFALILTSFSHAILDNNANGMSDLWEKQHNNGNLFPASFLATADPDQDGWSNVTEAIAGTDPLLANPPDGIIATTIEPTGTEGAFTLTWPTIIGKNYRLQASSNLTDWLNVGTAIVGTTNSHTLGISAVQPDTTVPPKLFWRIVASDLDTDTDGLTNAEENTLGTDPNSADSDGDALLDKAEILAGTNPLDNDTDEDGIADNIDTTPLANNALADPDGAGLPANLNSTTSDSNGVKLLARYDFQSVSSGTNGGFPSSISGIGSASATAVGSDIFQNPSGMPSFTCRWNAAPVFNEYLRLPNSIINTKEKHAWSYWLKLPKNAFYVPPNTIGSGIRTLLSFGNGLVSGGTSTALPHLHWYVNLATNTIELESYFIQNNIGIRQVLGEGWAIPEAWHDGEWHHIVLHQNGSFYRFYFDGVNQGQQETNKVTAKLDGVNAYTLIGRRDLSSATASNTLYRFPAGTLLDRLRCYSKLTDADVLALYNQDIDNDGLYDRTEARERFWYDKNNNNIRNSDESEYVARPFQHDEVGTDHDRDGIASHSEQNSLIKTNASRPDTDGDLMIDGWEIANGLNPLVNDAEADLDNDGASNIDEYRYASKANSTDSDGDGTNDSTEITQGSHPNDARDGGQPIPVAEQLPIFLGVGDESDSHSEDYVINCFRIDPATGAELPYYVLRSGGHGLYEEETVNIFRKEDTYTFQIKWISSSYQQNYNDGEPDFDYTLKITSPNTEYATKFLDCYDAEKKVINLADSIRGVSVSDKNNFLYQIEVKRVALVNLKLEWVSFPSYDNVSYHIDPWDEKVKGNRIFPDFANPNEQVIRDKARLLITNGLPNIEVKLRNFDVDDSTSANFDKDYHDAFTVIDPSPNGNDNIGNGGYFWDGFQWTLLDVVMKCDTTGKQSIDFKVSMQPGDNYRVCAELMPAPKIGEVTVNTVHSGYFLGFDNELTPHLALSPPLTVWRQLWLEQDTMESIAFDSYGYKTNNLKALDNIKYVDLVNGNTRILTNAIDDISSATELENGRIIINSTEYAVKSVDHSFELFEVAGDQTSNIATNMEFRLYDDDDFGLDNPPLPVNDAYSNIKPLLKPAFIELMDGSQFNPDKILPFYRNHGPLGGIFPFLNAGIFDDAKNLSSTNALWVANLIYAYQGEPKEDRDPNTEDYLEGGTPANRQYSVVYCETIRDGMDYLFRIDEYDKVELSNLARKRIHLTAAHEIGHMPGSGTENEHHSETLLMENGYEDDDSLNIYSPQTIKRFRSTINWQQP